VRQRNDGASGWRLRSASSLSCRGEAIFVAAREALDDLAEFADACGFLAELMRPGPS